LRGGKKCGDIWTKRDSETGKTERGQGRENDGYGQLPVLIPLQSLPTQLAVVFNKRKGGLRPCCSRNREEVNVPIFRRDDDLTRGSVGKILISGNPPHLRGQCNQGAISGRGQAGKDNCGEKTEKSGAGQSKTESTRKGKRPRRAPPNDIKVK